MTNCSASVKRPYLPHRQFVQLSPGRYHCLHLYRKRSPPQLPLLHGLITIHLPKVRRHRYHITKQLHRSKVSPETSIRHGKAAQQNHGKALSKPIWITITVPLLSLYPRLCYPIPISLLRSVRRFGCRQVYRLITRRTKV